MIPNIFLPVTTISSTAVNANFAAVAAAVVASAALDGSTTFTGGIRAADGTAPLPAFAFGTDPDTGLFRKGANQLGIAAGGAEIGYFDSSGLFTADLTLSDDLTVGDDATITGDLLLGGLFQLQHADTTLTRASAGNVNIAGNIVYRAGGTDVAIADGGTGQGTAASAFAALKQAASDTATGVVEFADQAEMEAGSSTTVVVTPGRQQFHPAHPKMFANVTISGGVATVQNSYNITSVVRSSNGVIDVVIATDFSGTGWALIGSTQFSSASYWFSYQGKTAGTFTGRNVNDSAASIDPPEWNFSGQGDWA